MATSKKIIALLFILCAGSFLYASAQPFKEDIINFKKQDSVNFPPKNSILFAGSSSFTNWTDIQNYFPSYPIINRGFGGSSLADVIRYADDVIFRYQPKQIVIYCGENDLAASDTVYPAMVAQRFMNLFTLIRTHYKKVPVVYISLKPSIARQHLMPRFDVANTMIKNFLKKQRKTKFIDVYHAMLKKDGTPMDDIFLEDKLHMNAKGYAIWQKLIEPYLVK